MEGEQQQYEAGKEHDDRRTQRRGTVAWGSLAWSTLALCCVDPVGEGTVVLKKLLFHLLENALFIFGKWHRQSPPCLQGNAL